jgi:hypothetical protein
LYVTNWYFIDQSADYFGADLESNPVLHFWSLAVEEQFYLVWPLLLGGLVWVGRRVGGGWRAVQVGVVVVGLASLGWAWSLRHTDALRAYYGTDTRAYQLMAGAALALAPGLLARLGRAGRWVATVAMVALVVVATSIVDVDPIERGVLVTIAVVGVLAGLEAMPTGFLQKVLSLPPVVYLGKISYGTYLWHWPVILIAGLITDLSATSTLAIAVLLATGLASLSFQLLEHPIRISKLLDRHRYPVIAGGLATSVLSAVVLVPAILEPPTTTGPITATTTGLTPGFPAVPDLDFEAIRNDFPGLTSCYGEVPAACTRVTGKGQHILLIGDSHAGMMIPAFRLMAEQHDLTLSIAVHPVCPWQRKLFVKGIASLNLKIEDCKREKDDLYDRVIPALDPDVIVVMDRAYEALTREFRYVDADLAPFEPGSPDLQPWLESNTIDAVDALRAGGRKVVLLQAAPYPAKEFDSLNCLAAASTVQECRFVVAPDPPLLDSVYDRLAKEDDQVWSIDMDRLICPFLPICDPIVDSRVVTTDGTHLTRDFSRTLAPALFDYMQENGIMGGPTG